jgi:hypothetical protein
MAENLPRGRSKSMTRSMRRLLCRHSLDADDVSGNQEIADCRYFQAAEGTRTLDLLHGKQTVIVSLLPLYPCISSTSPPSTRVARSQVSPLFAGVLAPNWHRDAAVSRCASPWFAAACMDTSAALAGERGLAIGNLGPVDMPVGHRRVCRHTAIPHVDGAPRIKRRASGSGGAPLAPRDARPLASARRRRRARGVDALARL